MKQHVKRTRLILFALVATLFATYIVLSPSKQERDFYAARRHVMVLEPLVHKEGRFRDVQMDCSTGGTLGVHGTVQSEEELKELKMIVGGSKPPVRVLYQITVIPKSLEKRQK